MSTERAAERRSPAAGHADEMIGSEIAGRYRVLAKLGEGGMGTVYRAEQISLKRKVALKILRPELSSHPGLVRRFNAEAELAARLNHPNTVTLFDFGQHEDGALFIAMEFVEGRSLREVLVREGALPLARAVHICRQVCASLGDAHEHQIVHRDLKPDNVMLAERGGERDVVRVLDFGIAKLRDESEGGVAPMTRAGDLIGTPQYMAPEQIRGDTVDSRTDVYALGAMLYEAVTGRLPFDAPSVMALLSKHLTETPIPPTQRRPDLGLPADLDHLVMQTLSKDPAQRPPTMAEFARRLDLLAGSGVYAASGHGSFAAPVSPRSYGTGASPQPFAAPLSEPVLSPVPQAPVSPVPQSMISAGPHPVGVIGTPPAPAVPVAASGTPAPHSLPVGEVGGGRRRWWIAAVCAIALVAAGAAVAMWRLGDDSGQSAESDDDDFDEDNPFEGLTEEQIEVLTEELGGGNLPNGQLYQDAHGFQVQLPLGFNGGSTGDGQAAFAGAVNGYQVGIIVASERFAGPVDQTRLANEAQQFMTSLGWVTTGSAGGVVQGHASLVGTAQNQLTGSVAGFVVYQRGDLGVLVMCGSDPYSQAQIAAFCAEVFERRVILPD